LQPKLFVIRLLLSVGALMIVSLIVFSQVVTSTITTTATATSEMKDIELEDKAIKHELEPMETKEIEKEDNMAKQQEEEEEQPLPLGITIIQEPPLPQSPLPNNVTSTIPPTALAGADQVVKEGDKVTLDGTGSFDPDGTIVSYEWTLEEWDDEDPPPANLSGANTTTATFTAPVLNSTSGAYGFDLIVTDNDGLTHTDSTVVTVKKAASEESNLQ
jgi:hypothetical protein